jgi:hypothetical protein
VKWKKKKYASIRSAILTDGVACLCQHRNAKDENQTTNEQWSILFFHFSGSLFFFSSFLFQSTFERDGFSQQRGFVEELFVFGFLLLVFA